MHNMGSSSTGGTDGGAAPRTNRAAQDKGMQRKSNISIAANAVGNFIKDGGTIGYVAGKIREANKRSKQNLMDYEGQAAGVTPMRGPNNFNDNNDGGNDTAPTQVARNVGGKIIIPPTTAEVSQSSATDVTYDARKTKAKGRSMTIRTNSRGIGKNTNTVLGTKSLLGA